MVVRKYGRPGENTVHMLEGKRDNIKITTKDDLAAAGAILKKLYIEM